MIGIFDSGMGGAFSLFEFKKLCPEADACLFADRENLPYGTKSEGELVRLACKNIDVLKGMGAERVLVACCTASTVYPLLPKEYQSIAVPIIEPTARAAADISENGKIGIISTEATAKSGKFREAIKLFHPDAEIFCVAAPELVFLAESGERDGRLSACGREIIKKTLLPFEKSGIDTLILGCTHFAYFEREIANTAGIRTVNSAREGAKRLAEMLV